MQDSQSTIKVSIFLVSADILAAPYIFKGLSEGQIRLRLEFGLVLGHGVSWGD